MPRAGNIFLMRKVFQNLFLLVVSIAAALGLSEIVLRGIGYTYYPSFNQYDRELGTALQPNAEGWWRSEGEAYVRINASGQRDDVEHSLTKTRGVLRIAVLGDSYAEGFQLPVEQLFWKVLERRLAECLVRPVEVMNFGVSGYGTARELLMLRHRVKPYNPDIVLLAFLTGNDVRDNHRDLNQVDYIPYFELREGRLHLDTSFLGSTKFKRSQSRGYQFVRRVLYRSRLVQLMQQFRYQFLVQLVQQFRYQLSALQERGTEKIAGNEPGLDNLVYSPPRSKPWRDAWAVTEALVVEVAQETHAMGSRFYLVTLSNGIQVHPDPGARANFARRLGIEDLYYPDLRIKRHAQSHGIDVLTLAPVLGKYASEKGIHLHGFSNTKPGDGHWNAEGHRVAGEKIADYLCESLPQP